MKFENVILAVLLVCIVFIGQMRISASALHDDSTEEDILVSEEDASKDALYYEEDASKDALYYEGLRYYLNGCRYSCEADYLQSYIEYLQLTLDACRMMYDAGDMTEADVKACEAQYAMGDAQRMQAVNESAYYRLYLKEHDLDYSDFKLKEVKKVHDAEYYFEHYPACDRMLVSRYVTDYRNAVSYIEAQKLEVEALRTKLEMDKLLLEAGELSEQAYAEQKAALAKAEYGLESYYIDMNLGWLSLTSYISQQ